MTCPPLIVFDLDGTLVDSAVDITAAVNRVLAARGLPAQTAEAVAGMVGDGVNPLIGRAFAAAGAVPDAGAAAEYVADYESNVAVETRLFAGISETLDALEQAGWRLAVCTNKPEHAARLLLDALGIGARFCAVGGGDSFAHQKPHPAHLLGTMEAAGGAVASTLMVGDHRNDVLAAQGAGVKAIFAGWGYGRPGMEDGAAAIAVAPGDLAEIAGRLIGRKEAVLF